MIIEALVTHSCSPIFASPLAHGPLHEEFLSRAFWWFLMFHLHLIFFHFITVFWYDFNRSRTCTLCFFYFWWYVLARAQQKNACFDGSCYYHFSWICFFLSTLWSTMCSISKNLQHTLSHYHLFLDSHRSWNFRSTCFWTISYFESTRQVCV